MLSLLLAKKLFFSPAALKKWQAFVLLAWGTLTAAITLLSLASAILDAFHEETMLTFKNIQGDFFVLIPESFSESTKNTAITHLQNKGFKTELFYEIPAMLTNPDKKTFASAIVQTRKLAEHPQAKSTKKISEAALDPKDGIILGVDLAKTLKVHIGDEITLLTSDLFLLETADDIADLALSLYVTSIITTGIEELDQGLALCDEQTISSINKDLQQQIHIHLPPTMHKKLTKAVIESILPLSVHHWLEQYPTLSSILSMEKKLFFAVVLLILTLILLFFPNLFLLLIEQKQATITTLIISGIPLKIIQQSIYLFGFFFILSANGIGIALAATICYFNNWLKLIPLPTNYYRDILILTVSWTTVLLLIFTSLAIGSILIWYTIRTITYKKVSNFVKKGLA